MITVIAFTLIFVKAVVLCADTPHYQSASRHGGDGGTEFKIVCPYNGAITGINYRSAARVDQIEFICTSFMGKTTFGPLGGGGGSSGKLFCPPGMYISSFYGRSDKKLDRLGIRCRKENEMYGDGQSQGEFGGDGGSEFDDSALSTGYRPISVLVRAGSEVDAIQVTYGNIPISRKLCDDCTQYQEEMAPKHGGIGGTLQSFVCPEEGVITGIRYRSADRLDSIQFFCTSSLGEATMGPYGGNGGTGPFDDKCPPGSYIGSIHGRSANRVDKLGIRCVKYGQSGSSTKRDGHGGDGGSEFDDESYSSKGQRPIEIRIWSGTEVDAIQIKYGNRDYFL